MRSHGNDPMGVEEICPGMSTAIPRVSMIAIFPHPEDRLRFLENPTDFASGTSPWLGHVLAMHLHQTISAQVAAWRAAGYACEDFPAVAEILDYQRIPGQNGTNPQSRYLRDPQIEALETYWWLRLVKNTPHILDLYRTSYSRNADLLKALHLDTDAVKETVMNDGIEAVWTKISADAGFVGEHKLESIRETLSLDYPSYILALTMGAGKTALIGAIIATEFALAMEYPDGPFMQNALVFAPGKTILGSLRQIASLPYHKILPDRLHKFFAATVKLIFTRDGDPDIPVIRGDSFNVIITNTEKIRITKESVRKGDLPGLFNPAREDEARGELANRRLQAIASLPRLGVFSDEAHHTYGKKMGDQLKRVRETIDYLHSQTELVAVVNTTGTPYLNRQPLLDVVFWYGLSQGIRDGILKPVAGHIHAYEFDDQSTDDFLAAVIDDFFTVYRDHRLPDGHAAKIAIYFPQVEDLKELRPIIEARLQLIGLSADIVLENTNQATAAELAAFDRLNTPDAPHRVILLVNKGTEGWDCPSLFACALARKLKTSNNFVLQAACRCLRQVTGNALPASIYLSEDNRRTLDKELTETFGESIRDLEHAQGESRTARIRLRKIAIPPLLVRRVVRRVQKSTTPPGKLALTLPGTSGDGLMRRRSFDMADPTGNRGVLVETTASADYTTAAEATDTFAAATRLAAVYRLDPMDLKAHLDSLYPGGDVPDVHLAEFAGQIETQVCRYTIIEETEDVALALVKPEGFDLSTDADGTICYTAEITYPVSKEHLLLAWDAFQHHPAAGLTFHYTPYNFDSRPEASFFEDLLAQLDIDPGEIADFFFTGALTSPNKTDFLVEYKDVDGRWRYYCPDFIIRRKDGRCLIVEIKRDDPALAADEERIARGDAPATTEGRKALAMRRWENLNPDRLKYQLVRVADSLPAGATREAAAFAREKINPITF